MTQLMDLNHFPALECFKNALLKKLNPYLFVRSSNFSTLYGAVEVLLKARMSCRSLGKLKESIKK